MLCRAPEHITLSANLTSQSKRLLEQMFGAVQGPLDRFRDVRQILFTACDAVPSLSSSSVAIVLACSHACLPLSISPRRRNASQLQMRERDSSNRAPVDFAAPVALAAAVNPRFRSPSDTAVSASSRSIRGSFPSGFGNFRRAASVASASCPLPPERCASASFRP